MVPLFLKYLLAFLLICFLNLCHPDWGKNKSRVLICIVLAANDFECFLRSFLAMAGVFGN